MLGNKKRKGGKSDGKPFALEEHRREAWNRNGSVTYRHVSLWEGWAIYQHWISIGIWDSIVQLSSFDLLASWFYKHSQILIGRWTSAAVTFIRKRRFLIHFLRGQEGLMQNRCILFLSERLYCVKIYYKKYIKYIKNILNDIQGSIVSGVRFVWMNRL